MVEQPIINELNAPFWQAARCGDLSVPHCSATGRPFWPPSPISPYAEGSDVEWRNVAQCGVVRASCIYRRVFLKAFEPLAPYAIVLVELEGGARLHAHVSDPQSVRAGDRVKLGFRVLVEGGSPALVAEQVD